MKEAIARFIRAVLSGKPNPVEWLLAWVALVCGIVLVAPFHTFDVAASYGVLDRLIDETVLAAGLIAVGVFSLWATGAGMVKMRRIATMIETVIFLFLAIVITLSVPYSLGNVFYVLAGYSAWAFVRMGLTASG